jgi:chromosome segregation ATPase
MSEAELEAELAEVRKKRDQLQAMNLRVTDNLRRAIEERDKAVKVNAAFQDQVASLQQKLRDMTRVGESYCAADAEMTVLCEESRRLADERDAAKRNYQAAVAERDAAERERTESRAEVVRLRAECEGLRADLSAQAPLLHQQVAIERKRHLELSEDYDRQNVVIASLEDTIKRTENAMKVAQGQHIDDRLLKGFLAVISRLADQAQDLLP